MMDKCACCGADVVVDNFNPAFDLTFCKSCNIDSERYVNIGELIEPPKADVDLPW